MLGPMSVDRFEELLGRTWGVDKMLKMLCTGFTGRVSVCLGYSTYRANVEGSEIRTACCQARE